MSEPLLFLLREPAVHNDLKLTRTQRTRLVELNHSFDGMLLASRNMPAKKSQAQVNKVLTATREQVSRLLTRSQQARLQQIKYRLRGISFVLLPQAAKQLRLSDRQKKEIEKIVQKTIKTINENKSSTFQGKDAHKKAQTARLSARKAEQKQILTKLDERQKQRLYGLLGRSFDTSRLGKVSFKAPEFSQGDEWLNSKALKLKDLRGKVVALHFYAFG